MSNYNTNANILIDLGPWVDVLAFPNYQISVGGDIMNKTTLKMLKHFRTKKRPEASVTLYHEGKGDIFSVNVLLHCHFDVFHKLPPTVYKNHRLIEVDDSD